MYRKSLWKQYEGWKKDYKWVDLTHTLSPNTPRGAGFPPMEETKISNYSEGYLAYHYRMVGQYGTHVDAPKHFVQDGRSLEGITPEEMVVPLCVLDLSKEAEKNNDVLVQMSHIGGWEKEFGTIPKGACVAVRTDWWKREDMDNCDEAGIKHYPGWSKEVLQFLVEQRRIIAIAHETYDADAGRYSVEEGLVCQQYMSEKGRYQLELLKNLDQVPPIGSLLFCGVPKVADGTGFTARCIALCPIIEE